ncbi:hypothetical protein QNM99_13160 [Pseudomonas sp. PCH446]
MIQWRDDIGKEPIDAAQSAGAYWAWTGAAKFADQSPVLKRVQIQAGTSQYVYYSCETFGQVAATVNFGKPVSEASKINAVNGIVARYQAYTNALTVLTEQMNFPDAGGKLNEQPEMFKPRRD